jgi:hypothetical protein
MGEKERILNKRLMDYQAEMARALLVGLGEIMSRDQVETNILPLLTEATKTGSFDRYMAGARTRMTIEIFKVMT